MFCNNCGTEIQNGDVFCSNCGAPVVRSGAPTVQNTVPVNQGPTPTNQWSAPVNQAPMYNNPAPMYAPMPQQGSGIKLWAIIIPAAALLLIIAIAAAVSSKNPRSSSGSGSSRAKASSSARESTASASFDSNRDTSDNARTAEPETPRDNEADRAEMDIFSELTEGIDWDFPDRENSYENAEGTYSYMDSAYNYYYMCEDNAGHHYASCMMSEGQVPSLVVTLGGERVPVIGLNSLVGSGQSFTIPSQFKAIYGSCGDYEEVIVPEGVLVISNRAFTGNEALKRLKLPNSLQYVGEIALNAPNLSEIEWNETIYDEKDAFLRAFHNAR